MTNLLMPLTGGLLIGLSSLIMLACLGRITGISGIFGGAITGEANSGFRLAFLVGLIAGPPVYHYLSALPAPAASEAGWPLTVVAGLLVGFGTRYAGGCTSGHGVCGIGRLSPRSIVATMVFIGSGIITVYIARHLVGVI
jgi:uncharacterized membrane protein YedE/YeeE